MRSRNIFLSVLICFILHACEKETKIDIPQSESRLVVNSILIANTLIEVYVGRSTYLLDIAAKYISNALVVVSSVSHKVDTLRYTENGVYQSGNQLSKEETTYTIEVSVSGFSKATAKTTVPKAVMFAGYVFKENAGIGKDGFDNHQLTVNFLDDADKENYYYLELSCSSTDTLPFEGYVHNNLWYSFSPIIIEEGSDEERVFSDILFNGKQATIAMNYGMWNYDDFYDLSYNLRAYLTVVNEDFYDFHKSYSLYNESTNDIWRANFPPQVFSNVENAFGIVAAACLSDSIYITY